ncbi:snake venom 5'-nucleotidase-like [Dendronephthya gigantea]|uniref:snake venom 5'-nucleotidase-like n=1 Tax=Dendronephthya gigantea TaxID=151771 RepID=UPI00106D3754|nr:snake venom 5'-nucleotidase-like [Dendronephthya gigantea]
MASAAKNSLLILHFNDVYNIDARDSEPVGGAARFQTKLKSFQDRNPLKFFCGDAFNPSVMSTIYEGQQMVPVLNAFKINGAVYGNHDFDFGVDDLLDFKKNSNYPWLMSNVFDNVTNNPLGDGEITLKIDWDGHKIGLIGLVEKDWLDTLGAVDVDEVNYKDFVTVGKELSKKLRDEGCDFIIALTHMRLENDQKLAASVPGVDIVLGGHDHDYGIYDVNGKQVIKSGTDFRNLSEVEITFSDGSFSVKTTRHDITSDIPEDPEVKAIVDKYQDKIEARMQIPLGKVAVDLDGLFANIRTKETNLGNLHADIMRNATRSDISIVNAGDLRWDAIKPAGVFRVEDLVSLLPFTPAPVVTLAITGAQLLEALENGVSKWPQQEGRFPQVSGIEFTFDPSKNAGQRVIAGTLKVEGEDVNLEKKYTLAVGAYIAGGGDGYDVLTQCEILVDEECGPEERTIVRNHFIACSIISGIRKVITGHRQNIAVVRRGEKRADKEKASGDYPIGTIAPQVEGRIKIVGQN